METMDPEQRERDTILPKLQAQLKYAYENSPFYKQKWDRAGVKPGDIRSLKDFEQIPILIKDEIRQDQIQLVVLMAEAGDSMQILKAGLMEIADILVVNNSDLPNSENIASAIRRMLDSSTRKAPWSPPVLLTSASLNKGLDTLYDTIWNHHRFRQEDGRGETRRREQLKAELLQDLQAGIAAAFSHDLFFKTEIDRLLEDIWKRKAAPWSAAQMILKEWLVSGGKNGNNRTGN